jgi:L-ribulose-5-phosphate 4-epimerase
MSEQEGVIKFQLQHQHSAALTNEQIKSIEVWRQLCCQTGLLGQSQSLYDGYAYGNISQRHGQHFIISGTQTSGQAKLTHSDYALVTDAVCHDNSLTSVGLTKPSSESLTHAQIYQLQPHVNFIIHAHCDDIWRKAEHFGMPSTSADVPYGTVEMTHAVEALFTSGKLQNQDVFAMMGHLDGVVSYAETASQAFNQLINWLAKARIES